MKTSPQEHITGSSSA